jgi:tRNA(Ile)-lysidine synthase
MGSSPFTATTSDHLLGVAERFLATLTPRQPLVVAFSGGTDSCALLWAVTRVASSYEVPVHAVHFDHRLDPDSRRRAEHALVLAGRLGAPCTLGIRDATRDRHGESPEARARRSRYAFLEAQRAQLGAQAIATAHHLDDQAETVLLRLLYGTGLRGLAAIRGAAGWLRRPLLALRRHELAAAVLAADLVPNDDPTNRDLGVPRNRVRALLLPHLAGDEPQLAARLAALAQAAGSTAAVLDRRIAARLDLRGDAAGASCALGALRALPAVVLPLAVAVLHDLAGQHFPPRQRAQRALCARLSAAAIAIDCGGGWRWRRMADRLILEPAASAAAPFTYTFAVPGACVIRELGVRITVQRTQAAAWMWRGSPTRVGFTLAAPTGRLTVRNRRPGDRLQPLGGAGARRLKELLIDKKVPALERDRLPLLCWGEDIVWVPGLTVAQPFRLRERTGWVWQATLEPAGVGVES